MEAPLKIPAPRCRALVRARQYRPTAILIFNPHSGRSWARRGEEIFRAKHELESAGYTAEILTTSGPGHATELARQAVQGGAGLVVVCGGDGTINETVCGLAHSEVPLAVLPGGTANVLARDLGLPLCIPAAARAIAGCVPRRIALGRAGSRYFVSMAGVGFDAGVVAEVQKPWKNTLGIASYVLEALRQAVFTAPRPFRLVVNGSCFEATFACISRTQYYGPLKMVREADLFSNEFRAYCFESRRRLRYFVYSAALLLNRLRRLHDVRHFSAAEVRCEPVDPSLRVLVQVDGELAGELPCTISVVPDALTLLAPPDA